MNIAVIKESLCLGGTERSVSNISRVLSEGNNVYTVLFDDNNIKYPYGGKLVGLSAPPKNGRIKKVWNSLVRSVRVRRMLRQNEIEVAFVFTAVSGTLLHEKFYNCKKIISCRDYGRLQRKPESYAHALKHSDAILFNSKYQKEYFTRRYPHFSKKSFVSYNVIDVDSIQKQANEDVEPEFTHFIEKCSTVIVSVGRFCKEKGFEYLLDSFYRAYQTNKKFGLVLVGDGELRENYERKIDELGLQENVFFAGFQSNPYKYVAKCDIYVLSSISEGFPNVVPEAMACGLPVICTNCLTGPAEILNKEANYELARDSYKICDYGILTPSFKNNRNYDNAIKCMAAAIQELSENKELYKYLQGCSAKRVKDFSALSALHELETVIDFVKEV